MFFKPSTFLSTSELLDVGATDQVHSIVWLLAASSCQDAVKHVPVRASYTARLIAHD